MLQIFIRVFTENNLLLLVKVFYRNGRSSGVVKPVHRAEAEGEGHGTVENEDENDHCDQAHQGHCGQVALAVEDGTKGRRSVGGVTTVVKYATVRLSLHKTVTHMHELQLYTSYSRPSHIRTPVI